MTLKLYKIRYDRKCLTKIADITADAQAEVDAKPKDDKSILRPVFSVSRSHLGQQWAQFNYAYVPEYGRFYFIDDIISQSYNMLELHLYVDVLQTYRTELLSTAFEIVRSQSINSSRYIDPELPLVCNKWQDPNSLRFGNIPATTGNNYIMTVAGGA